MRFLLIVVVLVVLFWAAYSSAYTVDRTEFVYVTQFGGPVVTRDGLTEGGLYAKLPWPIQSVRRLDRRLQYIDLPETELLTRDRRVLPEYVGVLGGSPVGSLTAVSWPALFASARRERLPGLEEDRGPNERTVAIDQTITVGTYVCWRIPDSKGVERFITRVGTPDQAKRILGEQVRTQLAAAIGQKRMDELISTERGRVEDSMTDISRQLTEGLQSRARSEYGIEIVDVRVRRTSHPAQVRESILDRIKSERNTKAAESRAEGEAVARTIRSKAEAEAADLDNQARESKRLTEQLARARANEVRFNAYKQDRVFAEELIELTQLLKAVGENTNLLLLSLSDPRWRFLRSPPGSGKMPEKPLTPDSSPRKGEGNNPGRMPPAPDEGGR